MHPRTTQQIIESLIDIDHQKSLKILNLFEKSLDHYFL